MAVAAATAAAAAEAVATPGASGVDEAKMDTGERVVIACRRLTSRWDANDQYARRAMKGLKLCSTKRFAHCVSNVYSR